MTTRQDLVAALARVDTDSRPASLRMSTALDVAVRAAVDLGWATSASEGVNRAVRDSLEAFARDLALQPHVAEHAHLRPTLAELTQAVAELDHDPLADEPSLIARAAEEIVRVKPDAEPDDVLVWALAVRRK